MTAADLINGAFEALGGVFVFNHCRVLLRDKQVAGVSKLSTAVFFAWGTWNLYYYPSLDQWLSFAGGIVIVCSNCCWLGMMLYYARWSGGRQWLSYNEWRGSNDGRPALLVKRIGGWRGWRVDLHCFVRADDPGCFHTHPASAFRLILSGGYDEELESGEIVRWRPLRFGIVRPALCHRVARLRSARSYSLWLRAPRFAAIEIRGAC